MATEWRLAILVDGEPLVSSLANVDIETTPEVRQEVADLLWEALREKLNGSD